MLERCPDNDSNISLEGSHGLWQNDSKNFEDLFNEMFSEKMKAFKLQKNKIMNLERQVKKATETVKSLEDKLLEQRVRHLENVLTIIQGEEYSSNNDVLDMKKSMKDLEEKVELHFDLIDQTASNTEAPRSQTRSNLNGSQFTLEEDTFSLMMCSKTFTKGWCLGFVSVLFQLSLVSMIFIDLFNKGEDATILNFRFFPPKVVVSCGQLLTIAFAILMQSDVITSVHTLFALKYENMDCWTDAIGIKDERTGISTWIGRVLLPNILKLTQGLSVLITTFIVIVQSVYVIDLLKDYTALFVISQLDNSIFAFAKYGYLGRQLMIQASETRTIRIDTKHSNKATMYKLLIMLVLMATMVVGWYLVLSGQMKGTFFQEAKPECFEIIDLASIPQFGNGICDSGPLDTAACDFDGGDCL